MKPLGRLSRRHSRDTQRSKEVDATKNNRPTKLVEFAKKDNKGNSVGCTEMADRPLIREPPVFRNTSAKLRRSTRMLHHGSNICQVILLL
jgi:hypothetical protein